MHVSCPCHLAASAPVHGIVECGFSHFCLVQSPLPFDGPRSIRHRRPAHIAALAIPSFTTLQRHGGPPGFQLTILWIETTSLGYTDSLKTLASTASGSFAPAKAQWRHLEANRLVRTCSHLAFDIMATTGAADDRSHWQCVPVVSSSAGPR